jgi:hypothetical protein
MEQSKPFPTNQILPTSVSREERTLCQSTLTTDIHRYTWKRQPLLNLIIDFFAWSR